MRCIFLHYPLACFLLLRWNDCYQVSGSCDWHMTWMVHTSSHLSHYEAQLSFVVAFTHTNGWSFIKGLVHPPSPPLPPSPQFMSSVYFIGHVAVFLWLLLYFAGLGRVATRLGHNDTKQKTQ